MIFNKKIKKVGYQGAVGSNSERASKAFIKSNELGMCELVPCLDSDGVVQALLSGKIDFGVVARKNVIAGEVAETAQALLKIDYFLNDSLNLPIHHCLCTLPGVALEDVSEIVSHPQAIAQTDKFLSFKFPHINRTEYQDTALAAQDLKNGKLARKVAVITTREAAAESQLKIHFENISNVENNYTNFMLISDCQKIKKEWFVQLINKYKSEYLVQGLIAAGLGICTALHKIFQVDFSAAVTSAMGAVGSVFVFLHSDYFANFVASKNIGGYWKYKIEQFGNADLGVAHQEVIRLASFSFDDGALRIKGWLPGKAKNLLFISTRTFNTDFDSSSGLVFYEYTTVSESSDKLTFQGYVTLEYFLEDSDTKIFRMSGRYIGKSIANGNTAPDSGRMIYQRISKYEFDMLKYQSEESQKLSSPMTKEDYFKKAS